MIDVKTKTRRKTPRAKIPFSEIVYLSFPTGNGAVVLDVSSAGLGFQAADSLEPNESLSFRLSGPSCPDLDLLGKVAWLDSSRRRGGLLLDLSAANRATFLEWQQKHVDPDAPADELASPPRPAAAPGPVSSTPDSAPPPRPARARNGQAPPPLLRRPNPGLGSFGPNFVSEWDQPEPPHAGRNLLTVAVILALCAVIAGGSYYLAARRQTGNLVIRLGQVIRGPSQQANVPPASLPQPNSGLQPAPAAPNQPALGQPPSSPNALAQNSGANVPPPAPQANMPTGPTAPSAVSSSGTLQPAAPAAPQSQVDPAAPSPAHSGSYIPAAQSAPPLNAMPQAPDVNPGSAVGGNSAGPATGASNLARATARAQSRPAHVASAAPRSAAPADDGETDLAEAQRYLAGSNPQDSAVAAELLWSAVGKGNTQAELVLGGLYLRGQGAVHRNCRQAEVLLHAALVADVPGAAQEFDELQTYGCR